MWTVRQAGERELVVSFVGSPPDRAQLRAVADETPSEVVVRVVDDAPPPPPGPARAVGYGWSLPVQLRQPLADRRVLDPLGGVLEVVRGLVPAVLPAGFRYLRDSGSPVGASLVYGRDDGAALFVTTWRPPGPPAETGFTDRGTREGLRLLEQEPVQRVVVVERAALTCWVSASRSRRGELLTWDELLEVAVSVR